MISFKKLTLIVGYLAFFLFFGVLAFLFVGFIERDAGIHEKIRFEVKEKAKGVDLWRVSKNKRYHLLADDMIKEKGGIIKLINPRIWIFQDSKKPEYVQAKIAYVYPNNNVRSVGEVLFKRKDLSIYADDVVWVNSKSILKSNKKFKGLNNKSVFKGLSFIYYASSSVLKANGVDMWIK